MRLAVDQPCADESIHHPPSGRRLHAQDTGQRGEVDRTPIRQDYQDPELRNGDGLVDQRDRVSRDGHQ